MSKISVLTALAVLSVGNIGILVGGLGLVGPGTANPAYNYKLDKDKQYRCWVYLDGSWKDQGLKIHDECAPIAISRNTAYIITHPNHNDANTLYNRYVTYCGTCGGNPDCRPCEIVTSTKPQPEPTAPAPAPLIPYKVIRLAQAFSEHRKETIDFFNARIQESTDRQEKLVTICRFYAQNAEQSTYDPSKAELHCGSVPPVVVAEIAKKFSLW